MKLKFINKTDWSYRSLRLIVHTALFNEADLAKSYLIIAAHTKFNNSVSGDVDENGTIVIRLPSPEMRQRSINAGGLKETYMAWLLPMFGQVLVHEIGHTLGLEHCDMLEFDKIGVSWVKEMKLESKEEERAKRNAKI